MKSLEEIEALIVDNKKLLYKKYPIKTLAIFGSFARKEQNSHSDLDVLVEFNDSIGIRFIELAAELEKITGTKVDLVSRRGLKDKYFKAIQTELIYV